MILEGRKLLKQLVNFLSHTFISLSYTIELNCCKCVFWFCSAEIGAEAKIDEGTRSIFIRSSFQQLHTMLQKI